MKKAIQTTHELNAPLNPVWNLVKTGANWENWLPILTDSRVEGNTRYCDLENGDVLEEKFLASDIEKTFMYAIEKQQSFPATDITAIMRLEENGKGTRLHWSVEMEVESEEAFQGLKENIEGIYSASAQKLAELALTKA